jgi:pimeloyl-ACP methyl ester carboxylesterase
VESNIKIKNKFGEELDVLVEGNGDSNTTIVFVHGFGTDKNEAFNYFSDLALSLKNRFRLVRFDFSGYGKSGGKQEDTNYQKQAGDLGSVLEYVKVNFRGKVFILAHSMGSFVTSCLSPTGVERTVFSGIPNSNTRYIVERLKGRIASREGAFVDTEGITTYPRTFGPVQKIGPSFWKALLAFNPVEAVREYSKKTNLLIIHFNQDDVVGNEYMNEYSTISNVNIESLDGNHSVTRNEDRATVIKTIKEFFTS